MYCMELQFWEDCARRPAAAGSRRAQRGEGRAQAEGVKRESGCAGTFLPSAAEARAQPQQVPRSGTCSVAATRRSE